MSGEEKNKLDELFKNGLGEPDTHFEFNDQDWDGLEEMLDARDKPRGIVYWLPILSGVAAMLLLFLGWWMFKPAPVTPNSVAVVKTQGGAQQPTGSNPAKTGTSVNGTEASPATNNATSQPAESTDGKVTPSAPVYASTTGVSTVHGKVNGPSAAKSEGSPGFKPTKVITETLQQDVLAANSGSNKENASTVSNNNTITQNAAVPNTTVQNPAVIAGSGNTGQIAANNNPTTTEAVPAATTDPAAKTDKKPKIKSPSAFKPQFGLAMLVSPDINGAGSFQNAKVGTNIGMLFSVGIKKLTISTGAAYSKKPYQIGFSRSSYIMLKETYKYDYADPAAVGPASFTVNVPS
jgi:hypothetical protein